MQPARILMVGDVVGAPGLRAVARCLPEIIREIGADLVVANGENVAGGRGITAETARELHSAGVDVITSGNHVWDKKEIIGRLDDFPRLLRPANYPPVAPGRGWCVVETPRGPVGVLNLAGRIFMDPLDCPFRAADAVLADLGPRTRVVVVDFHAEATSEKRAMGFYLDGRVSALVGTHTHVPTADAQVLPKGTGYITDMGMTGAVASVIGVPPSRAVERFLSQISKPLGVAEGQPVLNGALVTVEPSGRCLSVERIEVG